MRIVLLSVLVLASACQRSSDAPAKEAPEASAAKETQVPTSAKVVAKTESQDKAKGDEGGSCGDGMEGEGSCAGGCNQWDDAANDVLRRELPADAKWTKFAVEGMTCGGCERRVIANVGSLEGVLKVEADAELGQVRVATKDEGTVIASAKAKIQSLGYRVAD